MEFLDCAWLVAFGKCFALQTNHKGTKEIAVGDKEDDENVSGISLLQIGKKSCMRKVTWKK